jgi:hypothetical protein
MSNPSNIVDLTQSLADFLTTHSALLQQKIDKPGGKVPDAGTIRNTGAGWGNFIDDFLVAYMGSEGRSKKVIGATTDAVQTDIGSVFAVPDGGQVVLEFFGWGRVGPNDFIYKRIEFRAENNAGAVQTYVDVAGTPQYSSGGTLSTADIVLSDVGTNVNILVTGEAVTNVSWETITRCTSVSSWAFTKDSKMLLSA